MILGTAELGMKYGINNKTGKPNQAQAMKLLHAAWDSGIRELDTAAVYGDAEKFIGLFQETTQCHFQIDTKLPLLPDIAQYKRILKESFQKLQTERTHLLYLHSFRQCLDKETFAFLKSLKAEGKTEQIGVSIYEPSEMEHILDYLPEVDVIQFPFHLFNGWNWKRERLLLARAKASGRRLYVRSVYLQGLVFRSPDDLFVRSLGVEKYIAEMRRICQRESLTVPQLACRYVTSHKEISEVILGCQTPEEVGNNLGALEGVEPLAWNIMEELDSVMRDFPPNAADPRKWEAL